MVTLAISSCGLTHTTNGDIVVKKEPSSIVHFLNVTVESTESDTLITGTLEQKKEQADEKYLVMLMWQFLPKTKKS
jgi:hypothetical protein